MLDSHSISSTSHFLLPTSQRAANPGLSLRNRQYHTPPIDTVKSQFYPTVVFTTHFPQVHLRQLTIWIVKLIVIILRETGIQLTENTMCINYKHQPSVSLRTIITVSSNKQTNVSEKCTPFRQKRISTQGLLNLLVRPSAGTHVAT